MRSHTHMHTCAASQLQTKRPQHIFLPSPSPSPVPASPARFLCKCSCFVFAPSALANPLDYVACLPFFRYFFIWFHFISFFSFAAYLLDLPICGVLICYPVAAPFLLLSPSLSLSATPHFHIPRAGPWCWLVACGWGCGWFHCLHCQAPNPLAPSQNEPLKAMRFLASGDGDGDGVGVYQIKYLWKI